jgi:hypothetical protein
MAGQGTKGDLTCLVITLSFIGTVLALGYLAFG